MNEPKRIRVGNRQHRWLYGGSNCWNSEPYQFHTSTGRPPPVLEGLIVKGWMWAHRVPRMRWMPKKRRWSELPTPDYWCGLTKKGRAVIEARKMWLDAYHQKIDSDMALSVGKSD